MILSTLWHYVTLVLDRMTNYNDSSDDNGSHARSVNVTSLRLALCLSLVGMAPNHPKEMPTLNKTLSFAGLLWFSVQLWNLYAIIADRSISNRWLVLHVQHAPAKSSHVRVTWEYKEHQTQAFICILIFFGIVPYLEGNKLQNQVAFCACSGV